MKKVLLIAGMVVLLLIAAAGFYLWKGYSKFLEVQVVRLDPRLTVYLGGGGNSIVLTSADGSTALVVDTKMWSAAEKMKSRVQAREVIIVNTHAHNDHTGGNALYPQSKIIAGAYTREQWEKDAGKDNRYPDIALKSGEEKELKIGDETVRVRNMGRAHSWDDVVVYLVNHRLLVTGDLVFVDMHPALHARSGAHSTAWRAILDSLSRDFDIGILVPGHGNISGPGGLEEMKIYFASVEDALGNPEKLAVLREKYKYYYSIPGIISFNKVVDFMTDEKKNK